MKIRVYYGETEGYNYIRMVLGNREIIHTDTINDIDICQENIPEIIDSIKFDEWDWGGFADVYGTCALNYNGHTFCRKLTLNEIKETLYETEKICESKDYESDESFMSNFMKLTNDCDWSGRSKEC